MGAEIGIILPFKNEELYLQECLESIKAQTFDNFSVYMVNDHSTDKSPEVANNFCKEDPRFKLKNNHGKGVIDALKTASLQVKEPFISRMDGDDIMPPKKLELLREKLISHPSEKTVVSGCVKYFGDNEISEGYQRYENWLNQCCIQQNFNANIYRECVIPACAWMMHTSTFLSLADFDNLDFPEDYHLLLNWFKGGCDFVGIPDLVHHWRDHSARSSKTSDNYSIRKFFELKLRFILHEKEKQLFLWGKGSKMELLLDILKSYKIKSTLLNNPNTATEQLRKHFKLGYKVLSVVGSDSGLEQSKAFFEDTGLNLNQDFFLL